MRTEIRVYPGDSETADADQRNDGRKHGESDTAQRTDQNIHHSAGKVQQTNDRDPVAAVLNGRGIIGINADQRLFQQQRNSVQPGTEQEHEAETPEKHFANPVVFAGTVVLSDKAERRVMKRIHGHVNEAFNVGTGGVSRNGKVSERIDGRLNQHIGKGENALALCNALEENLLKDNADPSKVDFVVPDYIKHTFEWLLQ